VIRPDRDQLDALVARLKLDAAVRLAAAAGARVRGRFPVEQTPDGIAAGPGAMEAEYGTPESAPDPWAVPAIMDLVNGGTDRG